MLFLKNAEPSQKARYLQYARYINQANEKVIGQLTQQQQELNIQEQNIETQLQRLKKLKAQQQQTLSKLGRANATAQQDSNNLSADIERQSNRLNTLKTDEQRLNSILADISRRQAAKRKQEAAARQKAAQMRIAAANEARAAARAQHKQLAKKTTRPDTNTQSRGTQPIKTTPIPSSTLTAEDRNLKAPDNAGAELIRTGFSRLQGQMRRPVAGSISGGFGQARASGGTWKGIFIATPPTSVQSIAAGTVAYAAPLQGYGNTVIVDHGDGYLSVYTGLTSINVSSGSDINARQSLGTSGTLPGGEQGLYFEIRYRNQAMNPLSWVR